jgi:predicted nucleotidyltransferase
MTDPSRSLQHRSPTFVISAGTQVVLKVSKALADGSYRKPGSVGVVVESPPTNDGAYLVQFADGQSATAYFRELVLRRNEVEAELGQTAEDLRPFIIYQCQVGSKAFGLAEEDADDDLRGIYLPPARLHWSLYALPEQLETQTDSHDEVYWELQKFLLLALKANPNVLETLWTPKMLLTTPLAEELRSMRAAFLSQHLFKTYSGYVLSQFRRMEAALRTGGRYKPKHAMHLVRLLYSGIHALKSGEILVDVSARRAELLRIKRGELPFEEVKRQALALEREFQAAYETTPLPEQPDFSRVNEFLVRARRSAVEV